MHMEEIMQVSDRHGQVENILAPVRRGNEYTRGQRGRLAFGHVPTQRYRTNSCSLSLRFLRNRQIALSLRACSWTSYGIVWR